MDADGPWGATPHPTGKLGRSFLHAGNKSHTAHPLSLSALAARTLEAQAQSPGCMLRPVGSYSLLAPGLGLDFPLQFLLIRAIVQHVSSVPEPHKDPARYTGFLSIHKKLPQTSRLRTTHIYSPRFWGGSPHGPHTAKSQWAGPAPPGAPGGPCPPLPASRGAAASPRGPSFVCTADRAAPSRLSDPDLLPPSQGPS